MVQHSHHNVISYIGTVVTCLQSEVKCSEYNFCTGDLEGCEKPGTDM